MESDINFSMNLTWEVPGYLVKNEVNISTEIEFQSKVQISSVIEMVK